MAFAEDIAVALLAAGQSERFGDADKLAAPLGHQPLIEWAAQAGHALPARWHFLVAGPAPAYDGRSLGYRLLTNGRPQQGLGASLKIAAEAAGEAGAKALIILLADMPFVGEAHLIRLAASFRADDGRPIFSRVREGAAQPPALFPAAYFPKLQSVEGDKGARAFAGDAIFVEADARQLMDIDTPDDLALARKMLAGTG